ncbi:MAG TPA: Hsp20/alpha crystallin family protein [Rhodanobacteraceae bacterium]|jgi:HSP20 family protein|nr:Hsp20/alpha crystallin family protein [Rhodanobacteraceae bacterium]
MYIHRSNAWPNAGQFPRDFSRAISRLFDVEDGDQSDVVTSQWAPRVDIREEDKRFVIAADIPGVDPKDIEINMDKGVLSIKGERKTESTTEGNAYTRVERAHGVFHRRFALPDSANPDGITATGKHGVLEISIPKRPETTPRKIDIQTGE